MSIHDLNEIHEFTIFACVARRRKWPVYASSEHLSAVLHSSNEHDSKSLTHALSLKTTPTTQKKKKHRNASKPSGARDFLFHPFGTSLSCSAAKVFLLHYDHLTNYQHHCKTLSRSIASSDTPSFAITGCQIEHEQLLSPVKEPCISKM